MRLLSPRAFVLLAVMLVLASMAKADGIFNPTATTGTTTVGGGEGINNLSIGGGGSGPPPTCSNKLDFSVACNSQYVSVLGLM